MVSIVAFFASHQPPTAAEQPNYKELVMKMQSRNLSDEEVRQIIEAGPAALDYILDSFVKSRFAQETVKKVKPGFNLGKAMDENTYARNVVKVAEAFGRVGVDRLVKRLPPDAVEVYNLDSKEFHELGIGTIKPLLTIDVLANASSKNDNPRLKQWASRFIEDRSMTETDPRARRQSFWASVAAGVVASAVWEGLKWAGKRMAEAHAAGDIDCLTSFQRRRDVPDSFMRDQLSPATRAKLSLRRLDAPPTGENFLEGFVLEPAGGPRGPVMTGMPAGRPR